MTTRSPTVPGPCQRPGGHLSHRPGRHAPQPRLLDPPFGEPIPHPAAQRIHQVLVGMLRVRRLVLPVAPRRPSAGVVLERGLQMQRNAGAAASSPDPAAPRADRDRRAPGATANGPGRRAEDPLELRVGRRTDPRPGRGRRVQPHQVGPPAAAGQRRRRGPRSPSPPPRNTRPRRGSRRTPTPTTAARARRPAGPAEAAPSRRGSLGPRPDRAGPGPARIAPGGPGTRPPPRGARPRSRSPGARGTPARTRPPRSRGGTGRTT